MHSANGEPPVRVGEHVEFLAQDELRHAVEAEPVDHIGNIGASAGCHVVLDALIHLFNQAKGLFFFADECCSWLANEFEISYRIYYLST